MTAKGAPGRLELYGDGTLAGNTEAPVTTPFVLDPGALTSGANPGSPVTDDYASPFKLTGAIRSAVDVSAELIRSTKPNCACTWPANRPPGSHTEEHAGMVDLDADGGPDNR